MNLSGTTILVWHFKNNVEKQKGHKSMSMDKPTIIYFEIYMYLRAHRGGWLHTSESCIGISGPDLQGQSNNIAQGDKYTRQMACYMKSHNAEILAFSKA